jgi:hypothetical protein
MMRHWKPFLLNSIFILTLSSCGDDSKAAPIQITIAPEFKQQEVNEIVDAINMWNTAVGKVVFEVSVKAESKIEIDNTIDSDGLTWFFHTGLCLIKIRKDILNLPIKNLKTALFAHELGHCIGIKEHSFNPKDLMFKKVGYDNDKLSDNDIKRARSILFPEGGASGE